MHHCWAKSVIHILLFSVIAKLVISSLYPLIQQMYLNPYCVSCIILGFRGVEVGEPMENPCSQGAHALPGAERQEVK